MNNMVIDQQVLVKFVDHKETSTNVGVTLNIFKLC